MIDRSITIHNLYVMMAYVFQAIRHEGNERFSSERFDHLHDLLAAILIRGVGAQVKRGLHHDYLPRSDELTTVRGRIDVAGTVRTRSATRGHLVCEFDEFESDTPHNRALKSVIVLLIRRGDVTVQRRDELRRLLPYLEDVASVAPTSIRWNLLTYHRANATYRLLLGVCELVVKGLLPAEEPGVTKLTSWVSGDVMSSLYERFVRQYYAVHHPELSPRASTIAWDYDGVSAIGGEQLPAMRTDVTLRRGQRTLIVDTKYYSQSMQAGMWGKATIHSANLYQVLAYAKNADTQRDGTVSGLLLYARTDAPKQPDLDVMIQGTRIGARTLDLNRPWEQIRAQLEEIINWLDADE